MTEDSKRILILEMLENGKISAEEALALIHALGPEDEASPDQSPPAIPPATGLEAAGATTDQAPAQETPASAAPPGEPTGQGAAHEKAEPEILGNVQTKGIPPEWARWRQFWSIPFWVGVGTTILGAVFMYMAMQNSGLGFWFFCTGVLFTIGLILMIVGWQSRTARWLHLRVTQAPGERPQNIAFSFPIPLRLTGWFLRTFKHRIPNMEPANLDEIIVALGESTSPENPLYVEVDEGENGERVEIYIG
jgi:hypothetical protein